MGRHYATSRETEAGTIVENFIDEFLTDDFAEGYDAVMEMLEVVAAKVDKVSKELELRIESLEEEMEAYEEELETLKGAQA